MPHRNAGNGNFAPCLRRADYAIDLTRQFNSRSLAKSKAPNVFVKFLVADGEREFRRTDVARFDQNIADAQITIRAVIVKWRATIIPNTVFTKNLRIWAQLAFV